ncbi:hypothetical protein BN1708_019931, partial [Verticillium longisporum]
HRPRRLVRLRRPLPLGPRHCLGHAQHREPLQPQRPGL